jgi:hypothetical protein
MSKNPSIPTGSRGSNTSAPHHGADPAAGLAGGAIYDGLVGAAAREHRVLLVSCDRRAEPTYRALGVTYELLR